MPRHTYSTQYTPWTGHSSVTSSRDTAAWVAAPDDVMEEPPLQPSNPIPIQVSTTQDLLRELERNATTRARKSVAETAQRIHKDAAICKECRGAVVCVKHRGEAVKF